MQTTFWCVIFSRCYGYFIDFLLNFNRYSLFSLFTVSVCANLKRKLYELFLFLDDFFMCFLCNENVLSFKFNFYE